MMQSDLFASGANEPSAQAESLQNDEITLAQYAEQAYLDYAVSVVKGRALPDVSDGQKPVQRRILYAMSAMGLRSGAKPVKSARVVGDVLGKYHPHGDQAAYDAMVRMAQDFVLRYPLIEGQGNFGSRDGDNAAAMRYTEARLTPFANLLLEELSEGTVDFEPNYDGSQKEPVLLPARLPIVLLNGASGIAVGMATEIPPHNLTEVAQACIQLLEKPDLDDETFYQLIPGPDFPGGGQIITSPSDITQVYKQGRGSIKVRALWEIEELARGQWQLVVNELPPGASSQKILEEIEEKTNPRIRAGRKALTPEQQQTRALLLGLLDTVRDESGKDAPVRLVFEPKSSRIDRDEFITTLLAQTSMEGNVSINLVSIGIDGRPGQRTLRQMLEEWLQFRADTVRKRTQFRLDKVTDRIHILEGRMIVYLDVDAVIRTIRDADEPKDALIKRFSLSERQAEDILEMRLRQLARLEGFKIEQELAKQRKEQAALQKLLKSKTAFKRLLIKEINQDAENFSDARRTLIQEAERAVLETRVVDEPITVIMSQQGWLRRRQGHGHDVQQFSFKSGDAYYDAREARSTDELIALGTDGRTYTVQIGDLPSARGDGQPITALAEVNSAAPICHMMVGSAQQKILLGAESGYGFLSHLSDMSTRQKAGKQFVSVAANDTLLRPVYVQPDHVLLALLTAKSRFLVISLDELRTLSGGGRGTKLIDLDEDDHVVAWATGPENGFVISGIYRRRATDWLIQGTTLESYLGKRARKGKSLERKITEMVLTPFSAVTE
ncbi:MAG TPA: DNA topoisomerase IV subunit A [Paenalcaligenes hominis]|uniref:DNA topoisomerase 4 subunit A n=1 Tax=Paenalcaligenes hominis TaxID=643674 RepID=A0A9D2VFJ1_9BURK|nr:DNA topoisomerase IV subunit A [Paenalcaligenes hominis]